MVTVSKPTSMARYQLLLYFIMTYAISFATAFASRAYPELSKPLALFLQVPGPTIVAVILTGIFEGGGAVKRLLLRLVQWRVGAFWYVAATALFWVPLLVAFVYRLIGNPVPGPAPGLTPWLLLSYVALQLWGGPLVEEAGWRGYALPRLQQDFNALTSSVILGIVWACWHLPFYAISGGGAGVPFAIYLPLTITVTIFITWIYNNTRGSLMLCVLTHFAYNAASGFIAGYLGLLPRMVFNMGCAAGLLGMVIAIVIYFGPKHLSRQATRVVA